MKKLAYIFSSFALALTMVGCQETWDDNPKLNPQPSSGGYEDFLNVPEMADQYIVLTKDTQNGTMTLTCSQPDYGFAAVANYTVQLSLAPDFSTVTVEDCPVFVSLPNVYTDCSNITFTNADLYAAMCEMLGIEDATKVPTAYYPLYIRLVADIQRQQQATGIVPNTTIYSNIVSIKGVSVDYWQPSEPGVLYVIGEPQGWTITDGSIVINETGAGTGIYTGSFNVPEGKFMFRFYSKLGDWEANSIGSQVDDNPIEIAMGSDGYFGNCVWGKGSWSDPTWAGGMIDVEVNLNDMTVNFVPSVPRTIYIIGAPQGWDIGSKALSITETGVGTNVYEGTITVNAGDFMFRFYTEVGDWEANSIGSQVDDNPINISVAPSYTGACVEGKGSWSDPNWAGGDVAITLDLNAFSVTFEAQ